MLVGTVVGNVWATQKDATLEGLRFLVVQPFTLEGQTAETLVAADPIGAGIGERVLVVFGRAARHAIGRGQDIGFQTAVAAIIDGLTPDELLAMRTFQSRWDHTCLFGVLHVLEHFSGHAGQIYAYTKQTLGVDLKFWDL